MLSDLSPSCYCVSRLGWGDLYDWQAIALDRLENSGSKVALRTCNESGKTRRVIAGSILWHMECFQKSMTVVTSGSWLQIEGQLIPSLKSACDERGGSHFTWYKNRGVCDATGSEIRWFSTDEAGRAEGWHEGQLSGKSRGWERGVNQLKGYGVSDLEWNELTEGKVNTSLMIVLDEAKSISSGIWFAIERCHPTRLLVASSPGASSGDFYDCFHTHKDRYVCLHASARDCPHLWDHPGRRAELEEQLKTYPKHLTDSMVFGEFSQSSDNMLFDGAAITRSMSGMTPQWGRGRIRVAMDLSAGGDGSPMYMCNGNEVTLVREWHERDTFKMVGEIIRELTRLQVRPEWVCMDNGGLGLPVIDLLHGRGWEVNRIDFGGKPRQARYFANVRAEMYSLLANRIQNDELRLPKDDTSLKDQLMWQKYMDVDGPLQLIPKKRLPHSPDRSDTLAMLFYDFPLASEYKAEVKTNVHESRTGKWSMTEVEDFSNTGLWS